MQTGILDRTRIVSNILMLILLAGNIFFSIQYTQSLGIAGGDEEEAKATTRLQTSRFLKYFIDTVLNAEGEISYEDRVKLENDIRELNDPELTQQWETFVSSSNAEAAQSAAVKLMSLLTNRML